MDWDVEFVGREEGVEVSENAGVDTSVARVSVRAGELQQPQGNLLYFGGGV